MWRITAVTLLWHNFNVRRLTAKKNDKLKLEDTHRWASSGRMQKHWKTFNNNNTRKLFKGDGQRGCTHHTHCNNVTTAISKLNGRGERRKNQESSNGQLPAKICTSKSALERQQWCHFYETERVKIYKNCGRYCWLDARGHERSWSVKDFDFINERV